MVEGMSFRKEVAFSQFIDDEALEQDPEFSLQQVKISINKSLDNLGLLKIDQDSIEKKELMQILNNLRIQLRQLEEKVLAKKQKEKELENQKLQEPSLN